MIEPPDRIGGEAQALVRIVKREVNGGGRTMDWQQVSDEGRFAGLSGACEHRDRATRKPGPQQVHEPPGVERHFRPIVNDTARFQGEFAERLP